MSQDQVASARQIAAAARLGEAILEFVLAIHERPEHPHSNLRECSPRPPNAPRITTPKDTSSGDELLPTREAARYLGISPRTIWGLTFPRGPLPVSRFGRAVRYSRSDLDAFIVRSKKVGGLL